MPKKLLGGFSLAVVLLAFAGCAPVEVDEGPPPPQNLLGSTDELQLVAELSLEQAGRYGGDKVLVALELENTLLVTDGNELCGSQNADTRLAQDDAAKLVERMQEAGLKVIVLTSRRPDCHRQTLDQLNQNGFDLVKNAWLPQAGYQEAFSAQGTLSPVSYQQGVLYAAGQDKGLVLKALLEKSPAAFPVLIVIADHQQADLNAVMKAFSWTDTKVHAWRYTR